MYCLGIIVLSKRGKSSGKYVQHMNQEQVRVRLVSGKCCHLYFGSKEAVEVLCGFLL